MSKQGFAGAFLCALSLCGSGCGDSAPNNGAQTGSLGATCAPGATVPCSCVDGFVSMQTCGPNGALGLCLCEGHGGPGAGNTGNGAGFSGGVSGFSGGGISGISGGVAGLSGGAGIGAAGDGASGIGGAAGDGGGAGTGVMTTGADPKIPTITDACPMLKTGNVTVKGQTVQLWVGAKQADKKGAIFLYWHGTGQHSNEAQGLLGKALTEIPADGGIVASFESTTGKGTTTGNNVWYTGDYEMADVIVACAVQQLNIDIRRIYTGGCSAGGLQSGAMVYGRSSYLAGAMPNSGGTVGIPGTVTLEDPSHVPSLITAHGGTTDMVGVSFSMTSATEDNDIASKGGYVVDCDHGGGHCMLPAEASTAQWEFLKAHPFGVASDPYAAGLPMPPFPSYCKIIK